MGGLLTMILQCCEGKSATVIETREYQFDSQMVWLRYVAPVESAWLRDPVPLAWLLADGWREQIK
jgi:hypothetical protein